MADGIETRTQDELERTRIEMIRQGLEGTFWQWYSAVLRRELEQDLLDLASPDTPVDKVAYLRGAIRAKNEMLLLPSQLVQAYDVEQLDDQLDSEGEDLSQDTLGRRLSPIPRNVEE